MTASNQTWDDYFHQMIISNCHYWLNQAKTDVKLIIPEIPQVLRALTYGLRLPAAWSTARDLVRIISPTLLRQGQGVAWESYLIKSIERSQQENDPIEIDFRLELGNLYRLQGRLIEAQTYLQVALGLCEQYNSLHQYWAIINMLALVARISGQYDEAETYCQQVLDADQVSIKDRAEAFNVMGLVAYEHLQKTDALKNFDEALILYHSLNDPYQIARMLTNKGMVLQSDKRLIEAEQSYRDAIKQFQISNDTAEIFKPITNLGNVFLLKEEYQIACQYYLEALPTFRECNYLVELAHVYNNLGLAYTGLRNWKEAEDYFSASIDLWETLKDYYNLANVLDNLGTMFKKAQQFEQAYKVWGQALRTLNNLTDNPAKTRLQQVIKNQLEAHQKYVST